MSFNFGSTVTNDFSTFSDDEKLNYALKLALNRVQTWGKTPWYEEPSVVTSTLPNLTLKNKIPPGSDIETYYLVDPDLGKATDRNVLKAIGSNDYNTLTINTIDGSTYASNPPIRTKSGTQTISVTNNGETKTLLKGISKTMIAKYVYWQNKLTGKVTKSDGTGTTTNTTSGTGTYPDKTAPFASFMTLSNVQNDSYVNDRRVSTMKEGGSYSTLYDTLESYYSGLEIIHWSNIDADGTAPPSKRHPFFKVFIGLPTYSTYSDALKTNFNNIGVSSSQSGDNIGFTNKLLEGAMGSINGYKFYLSTWNKKTQQFKQKKEDTYGDANNLNILYFLSYSGFILNYGEKNILDGKANSIDDTSISIKYPPTISFVKYTGETFSDGIISQGNTLPAVEVSNDKDLFINTSDNTIHRLEDNNGTKTWVGIGGGGGGGDGDMEINGVLKIKNVNDSDPFFPFSIVNSSDEFRFLTMLNDDNTLIHMLDSTNKTKIVLNTDGFSYFNAGTVGIGTDNPNLDAKLDINSGYNLGGTGLYETNGINFSTSTSLYSWSLGYIGGYVKAGTDNSEVDVPGGLIFKTKPPNNLFNNDLTIRMVINAHGNVGIGTTNPGEKLEVGGNITANGNITAKASSEPILLIENTDTTLSENQRIGTIQFKQNDSSNFGTGIIGQIRMESIRRTPESTYSGNNAKMIFSTGYYAINSANIDAMTIQHDGNVGIGTDNPGEKLDVGGNITANGNITAKASSEPKLIIENTDTTLSENQEIGTIQFKINDNNSGNGIAAAIKMVSVDRAWDDIHYGEQADMRFCVSKYAQNNANIDAMTIQHDGNVGIGTTSPQAKLHINGGNVLINEVSSGTAAKIEFKPSYYIYSNQTYPSGDIGKITFTNRDSNKLTHITGHVFSGDHIPSIKFTGKTAWNGDVIDIMTIRGQSGNVGIGTTDPKYTLNVNGNVKIGTNQNVDLADPLFACVFANKTSSGSTNTYLRALNGIYQLDWGSDVAFGFVKSNGNTLKIGGNDAYQMTFGQNDVQCNVQFKAVNKDNQALQLIFERKPDYGRIQTINSGVDYNQVLSLQANDGRVGIGTTLPKAKLHIKGFYQNDAYVGSLGYRYFHDNTEHAGTKDFPSRKWGFVCDEDAIFLSVLFIASDERIKENIVEINDDLALQKLRDISCCWYNYKDRVNRGNDKVLGFIAQQVKEHLPEAVTQSEHFIPSEMKIIHTSWDGTKMSSNDLQDVSGVKYRFYVSNDISGNDISGNDQVEKEIIGNADNSFTFDQIYNNVFCYGKEVDDFHTLNKQKLFALNFSATQEIDRIQQKQLLDISGNKVEIELLKLENQDLKDEINIIKQENKALLSKLEAFEKRLQDANI